MYIHVDSVHGMIGCVCGYVVSDITTSDQCILDLSHQHFYEMIKVW